MTNYVVSTGQFTTNLGHADTATIEQTGTSLDIIDGGLEIVVGGGFALGNTVSSGQLTLSSGGSANGAILGVGGSETVSSFGVTSNETIRSGGHSLVLAGGFASAVTISSGGVEQLSSGAAQNVTVSAGGLLSGVGVASGVADYGSVAGVAVGSSLNVFSGGVASGVIDSGLAAPGDYYHYGLFVSSGAAATGTLVGAAGYLELDGTGSAAGTTVAAGGVVEGSGGGVLKGVTGNAGVISTLTVSGTLIDEAGGYDSANVFAAGATLSVAAGGSTYRATAEKGAVVSGAGVVSSLVDFGLVSGVSIGSSLDVSAGGVALGVIDSALAAPGAYYHYGLFVSSGASATGTVVGPAGYLELDGDGSAANTTVDHNGYVLANTASGVLEGVTSDAGVVSHAIVSGALIVLSGGYDQSDTLTAGAVAELEVGASTYHDVVDKGAGLSGGGLVWSLTDFGLVSGVTIASSLDVSSGGLALGVIDSALAAPGAYYHYGLFVSSGASATGTVVGKDGYLELDGTGSAANTTVSSGGVLSGNGGYLISSTTNAGTVEAVTVLGTLTDLAGGVDNADAIAAGAKDIVEAGAIASGVVVDAGAQLYGGGVVFSGDVYGLVSDVSIGERIYVHSGGQAADVTVSGLGAPGNYYQQGLFVQSGASATGTVVGNSGYLELDGNGSATNTVISAGGLVSGPSGEGFLEGTTTNAGEVVQTTIAGTLVDLAGAGDSSDVIASGGVDDVEAGAAAYHVTISSGGVLSGGGVVFSGDDFGMVSALSVGSSLDVGAGGVADGVVVSGLGAPGAYYHYGLFISSGASATGTIVGSAGYLELDGTGSAAGTLVKVGGLLSANGGSLVGVTSNLATVSAVTVAGELVDFAGATDQGDLIASGGLDVVEAGAVVYRDEVASGGVLSGAGVVSSLTDFGTVIAVSVGSSLNVSSGGVADDVTVQGLAAPGDYYHYGLFVSSAATATGTVVGAAGYLEVDAGAASATTVASGGVFYDNGLAVGAVVKSGGLLSGPGSAGGLIVASAGATVDLAAVVSGGVDDYYSGASETLTVSSGAVLALAGGTLSAGQNLQIGLVTATETVSGVTVLSGATVELAASLVETGATLDLTAADVLSGVTVESGATVAGPGLLEGQVVASSGATLSGESIGSGGALLLSGGAAASSLVVGKGAVVSGPGMLTGQTTDDGYVGGVQLGGELTVNPGAQLSGAALAPGTVVKVASGGELEGTLALAGPLTLVVQQGGVVSARSINEFYSSPPGSLTLPGGDTLELEEVVVAAGAVYAAGKQVSSVALDGVTLDPGATLALVAPVVLSGGTIDVRSGASVSGATVSSGGAIVVSSGGALVSPTVNGGATFGNGASLAGTLAGSGGVMIEGATLVLSSAAAFRGELVLNSGAVELAGAGGTDGPIDFAAGSSGSAELIVEAADTPAAGATFASELTNFSQNGDSVFLAGLANVGGSAVASGSTLALTDGGKTYDFRLGGQIAPSFVVTAVSGGTLITADPPAAAHALLVQAMATFAAPSEAPVAPPTSALASTSPLLAEPHPTVAGLAPHLAMRA